MTALLIGKCCCARRLQNCSTGSLRPYYATAADVAGFGPFFRYSCEPLQLGLAISGTAGLTRVQPAATVPYATCQQVIDSLTAFNTSSVSVTLSGVDAGLCPCVSGSVFRYRKHMEAHFDGTYTLPYAGSQCVGNAWWSTFDTGDLDVGVAYKGQRVTNCANTSAVLTLTKLRVSVVYNWSARRIVQVQAVPVNLFGSADLSLFVGAAFLASSVSSGGDYLPSATIANQGACSPGGADLSAPRISVSGTATVTGASL